jgi:hypothetical protein
MQNLKTSLLGFLRGKLKNLYQQDVLIKQHTTVPKKVLRASYKALYLITKAKKQNTISESLIMPVAIKIMEILYGKKYTDELKFMPLSNDTVSKRAREISDDMHEELLERIKKVPNLQFNLTNQLTFPI